MTDRWTDVHTYSETLRYKIINNCNDNFRTEAGSISLRGSPVHLPQPEPAPAEVPENHPAAAAALHGVDTAAPRNISHL